MTSHKVINPPQAGRQINDQRCKSLICEESENDTFRFGWSKKPRMDFLRPYNRAPVWGARINDGGYKSLIREESGNDTFRFPWSKKPVTGFLRPYIDTVVDPDEGGKKDE